jgi:Flp pilus assembly protein TadG
MLRDQQGAYAIIIGVLLIVFLGFLALAVDMGYLWAAKNELQNAADAGALAGAGFLMNPDGSINTNANQIGYDAATANKSTRIPVEVNWSGGNTGDVQRGHWSFATRTFTPNANTTQTNLWLRTKEDLDADVNFINAVMVITRRESLPVNMFVAGILGHDSIKVNAEAVAYVGFSGNVKKEEIDMPIAICAQSIVDENGTPTCTVGRMINSGSNVETHETAGWTNLEQAVNPDCSPNSDAPSPCAGGTNNNEVRGLVNDYCNPPIPEDENGMLCTNFDMGTMGGEAESAFKAFRNCWEQKSKGKTQPWGLNLPVINCPSNNVGTCEELLSMVPVEVVWVTGEGNDPEYLDIPTHMQDWHSSLDCSGCSGLPTPVEQRKCCWDDFVDHFNLKNMPGDTPAPYAKKSIYFKPDCDYQGQKGVTGGQNFGIMAQIPKLVE